MVCARDPSLKELKFTSRCFDQILKGGFDYKEDFDEEESPDYNHWRNNQTLIEHTPGSINWYHELSLMVGLLPNLRTLAFESLDPNEETLEVFWSEYTDNRSLQLVVCIDMDFSEDAEDFFRFMFRTPNVRAVQFESCVIGVSLGYMLGDTDEKEKEQFPRDLIFNQCNFHAVCDGGARLRFANGLTYIPGLYSIKFKGCSFGSSELRRKFFNFLDGYFDDDIDIFVDED